nr:hypothetical protein [Tanacetum cinerariifolium]
LKQNQGDVNDAMVLKKKTVVVTSDPLALIAKKTKVSKRKEKFVVSSYSEGSDVDDFSELKKITALLAKAFNRRKFYSKPINNNLRTSSASQSANKKQEKKVISQKIARKPKSRIKYYKTKMLLAKKDKDEQVLLAENHAWMESNSDSNQEINANMVFMVQIKKVLSDSEASSSFADNKISEGLEVAFRKSTYFVRTEDGVDLLTGDRSSNLYTISLNEVASNSSACLLAKASSSQSWLWHQRLSHLNFATINNLVKNNLLQGLPKMKFEKDHLCFDCEKGKFIGNTTSPKRILHQISHFIFFTWICVVFFLHSKDEASEVIISFIKRTQVNLQLQVQRVRTDNDTEFKNKTLSMFFDEVGITQQFSAARTPQKNGFVERRNQTLVEPTGTMLTFANLPLFIWAEAITTTCFTQNHSISHKHFDKTPYELMNKRKPNIKFFHVFGCRCYLLKDYDDVGKIKAKGYIGVFIGYLKESAAFIIYNKRTRKIHKSVNVNFDEISKMASKQFSLEPSLSNLNKTEKSSNPAVSQVSETSKKDLEDFFHNFYDEYFDSSKIMKSSIMNVESSNVKVLSHEEEAFHESSESFQEESSSSLLNDDVQQSSEEVETTFLNRILKEEVYVGQLPGFVSTQYPDHVYALDKALYGLKQAPRAWYGVLSQFLIDSGFQKDLMVKRFKISMMEEMKFFLGLQVNQISNGIFINQSKYILDILKRFGMENYDTVPTLMVEQAKIKLDLVGKPVGHTDYHSMIGSLMYVTSSRPDIMFTTCMCARYQKNPNEHHVSAVKRIFH